MLALGILLVVISTLYASSFLAILGVAIVFWGVILLYITPTKHVPLTILNAVATSANSNVERALSQTNCIEKGRYLPPTCLRDFESSMVFISENPHQSLPSQEEVAEGKMFVANGSIMLVTPPGFELSKLFEKEAGASFTKTDMDFVERKLPKVLVEDMELAENSELQVQGDKVTLEVKNSVLNANCQETRNLPRTHSQVGCLLSSAVACMLAKASGKVVTIQNEELSDEGVTKIEYLLESVDGYTRLAAVTNPLQAAQASQILTEKIAPTPVETTETVEVIAKTPDVIAEAEVNAKPENVGRKIGEREIRAKTLKLNGLPVFEAEVDSRALDFLNQHGEVYVLTEVVNPQFSYSGIQGYDEEVSVKFVEFAEISRSQEGSEGRDEDSELRISTFNVSSPADRAGSSLELYVTKSGFPTVSEWLKALSTMIPEGSGKKTLYLYHIQTVTH